LHGFQSGPSPCKENADAIYMLEGALKALKLRSARVAEDAAEDAVVADGEIPEGQSEVPIEIEDVRVGKPSSGEPTESTDTLTEATTASPTHSEGSSSSSSPSSFSSSSSSSSLTPLTGSSASSSSSSSEAGGESKTQHEG